jgi:hypothetical protein
MDAHNGGLEAQHGAMDGLKTRGRRFALRYFVEKDPDTGAFT